MRWLGILLVCTLSGCTLLPAAPTLATRPAQPIAAPFALNGRIAINHHGDRHSAGLRWTHEAESDELLLLGPLGQTAARIYRDARHATLDDGNQRYQAADAESLMQQVLGWHLPLHGLHHWIMGMAAPQSQAHIELNGNGQVVLLRQDAWEVRYLRYAGDNPDSLPARLQLSRDDLQVQLLVDEWDIR